MKKLFLLLVSVLIGISSAFAQAEDGVYLFGYGTNPFSKLTKIGAQKATTYDAAMPLGGGMMTGASIKAINLPIRKTTYLKDVSVWIASPFNLKEKLYTQNVDATTLEAESYNRIDLAEYFVVPAEGVYVGYTMTITNADSDEDKQPVYTDRSLKKEGLCMLAYDGLAFADYGSKYGALALQVYLSGMDVKSEYAYFGSADGFITEPSKAYEVTIPLKSDASTAVSNIEYTITVGAEIVTRTAEVALPAGLQQTADLAISFTSPAEYGAFTVALQVTKVNGKPNSCQDVTEIRFNNLKEYPKRVSVMEEFTGTECGWCPRGIVGMEMLRNKYPDNFIGIAIHGYNKTDPMYFTNYASLGFTTAPTSIMDRRTSYIDPLKGSGSYSNISGDFDACNAIKAVAEVSDLQAEFVGEDMKEVAINSAIEFYTAGRFEVVYVLTADNVYADNGRYSQYNFYAGNNIGNYSQAEKDYMGDFCNGGKYNSGNVSLHFNDVAIASSYGSNGVNTATPLMPAVAAQRQESAFIMAMPTRTALLDGLDYGQIYAVAMLIGPDGYVANAAKTKVTGFVDDAIRDINTASSDQQIGIYSIDGKRLSSLQPGLNIIKEGGKARKIFIK